MILAPNPNMGLHDATLQQVTVGQQMNTSIQVSSCNSSIQNFLHVHASHLPKVPEGVGDRGCPSRGDSA